MSMDVWTCPIRSSLLRMHADQSACNDSFLNWFKQTAPQLMHTTASCTLTPSMPKRDKSAYMLFKTLCTANISDNIKAYRKRLSALNAESASLEARRTALIQQIEVLDKEKAAWVNTNRSIRKDRKMCQHNRRPTRCFKEECKETATEVCRCSIGRYQKSPRLRKKCICRCGDCEFTGCSGLRVWHNGNNVIPAHGFLMPQ
jgi:hypothetical protein